MKNVLLPLAKRVLVVMGLPAATAAIDLTIQKKVFRRKSITRSNMLKDKWKMIDLKFAFAGILASKNRPKYQENPILDLLFYICLSTYCFLLYFLQLSYYPNFI